MRRTTIFHSSRALKVVAVLLFAAATTQAQVTTAAGTGGQLPTVHVVVTGETLWGIAERYFGDPYLWPEIYRINTMVVEDPHWIFPGEELRLTPPVAVEGDPGLVVVEPEVIDEDESLQGELPVEEPPEEIAPEPMAPRPPPTETAPTVFVPDRSESGRITGRRESSVYRYRALRAGDFYAAGFLTEEEALPWASVLGAVGKPMLSNLTASSSARVFGEIDIQAPESAVYQIGDTVLVAQLAREIADWGNVVVPAGLARVTNVAGASLRAEIVMQFNRIADGLVAMPVESFVNPGEVVPVPVENGVMGEVIAPRDRTAVPSGRDVIFINLGRSDGVTLGDVFEVLQPVGIDEGSAAADTKQIALLQIVHVRENSASGMLINIRDMGTASGVPVRLVRKMPS